MWGTVYTNHAHGVRQQAARGGRVRRLPVLGRFALCIFLAFALVCQPYTLSMQGWQIKAQKQEAKANPIVVQGSRAIIQWMAGTAGVTESDFILAWAFGLAASTGIQLFAQDMTYGNAGGVNVYEVLRYNDAWPEWDYLDDAYKLQWESREEYEAAKINTTFDTLGDGDSSFKRFRDDYYTAVANGEVEANPSGVDEFVRGLSTGSQNIVNAAETVGNWASSWSEGATVDFTSISSLITDPTQIFAQSGYGEVYKLQSEYNGYKINWAYYDVRGNTSAISYINSEQWIVRSEGLGKPQSSGNWISGYYISLGNQKAGYDANTQVNLRVWQGSYLYWPVPSTNYMYFSKDGLAYNLNYGHEYTVKPSDTLDTDGIALNHNFIGKYMLNGEEIPRDAIYQYAAIPDTDTDILENPDAAPEDYVQPYQDPQTGQYGLSANQPWPDYFTPTQVKPSEETKPSPDPGPEPTPTPEQNPTEFQEQLREKVNELIQTPFQGLFPFCLIYDAKRMMEIVNNRYNQSSGRDMSVITLPLSKFGLQTGYTNIELDLSPLVQLGNYVRPFTPWLVIAGLIAAAYSFFLRRGGE